MDQVTPEANNSSVEVEIFGQTFRLLDAPDYAFELAVYVDRKMRAVADETPAADSAHLAVLAALNIAEEYHQLKSQLGDKGRDTSGEAGSSSPNGEAISVRPGMELFDQNGNFVCELGEPRKALTDEERQRNRERRQRHHTKRWYEKQLLAIVNDESVPAKERRVALFALGRSRGYQQGPTGRR
jgi:cell division protein ZapA